MTTTVDSENDTATIIIAVVLGVLGMIMLIIAGVVIVVAIVCYRNKKHHPKSKGKHSVLE